MTISANFIAKGVFSSSAMYGSFMSVDKRRQLARDAAEAAARIELVSELKTAVSRQDQFLKGVSGEMRTPLNNIMGLADVLVRGSSVDAKALTFLKTLQKSGAQLVSIMDNVLDSAALKLGKLVTKHEPVCLPELVASVLDTIMPYTSKMVTLSARCNPDTPTILGDPSLLSRILYNLVSNALKTTSEGLVTVNVEPARDGDHIVITVEDTGLGISPMELKADASDGGSSLALTIVKELVTAHLGALEFKSEMGVGSTFVVVLPIQQPTSDAELLATRQKSRELAADYQKCILAVSPQDSIDDELKALRTGPMAGVPSRAASRKNSSRSLTQNLDIVDKHVKRASALTAHVSFRQGTRGQLAARPSFKIRPEPPTELSGVTTKPTYSAANGGYLVLSIDDDEVAHVLVEELLAPREFTIQQAYNGQEALDWINSQPTLPDLVLLDCVMPNMDGMTFCAEFRKTVPCSLVPIIMVSAKSSDDSIVDGLTVGNNDFLRKPLRGEELLARIDLHMKVKKEAALVSRLMQGTEPADSKAMALLQTILPAKIINRMQEGQKFIAESHPHVVVLFSDIVGFTPLSSTMHTGDVFVMLSNMFTAFDRLTDCFGVYKFETIGDAYMVVAGHDEDERKEALGRPVERMMKMAKAMLDVVRSMRPGLPSEAGQLQIRIGMHVGPAYSGVIGMKCPRYCFLGDTINTASRMESTGFPMAIHVSEAAYKDVNKADEFTLIGERHVKGKGLMKTFVAKAGLWKEALAAADDSPHTESSHAADSRLAQMTVEMRHIQEQHAQLTQDAETARHELAQMLEAEQTTKDKHAADEAVQQQLRAKLAAAEEAVAANNQRCQALQAQLEESTRLIHSLREDRHAQQAQREARAQRKGQHAPREADPSVGQLVPAVYPAGGPAPCALPAGLDFTLEASGPTGLKLRMDFRSPSISNRRHMETGSAPALLCSSHTSIDEEAE